MQYAILCYHSEDVVCSWTKEEDDAVMSKLKVVQDRLRMHLDQLIRDSAPSDPARATSLAYQAIDD